MENNFDNICVPFLYAACKQGKGCKYDHFDEDNSEFNFERAYLHVSGAAEKPYRFCEKFQVHPKACHKANCGLVHAHREDVDKYNRTGVITLGLARGLAALMRENENFIGGTAICRFYQNDGNCLRQACRYWHVNKLEEQRKRFAAVQHRPAPVFLQLKPKSFELKKKAEQEEVNNNKNNKPLFVGNDENSNKSTATPKAIFTTPEKKSRYRQKSPPESEEKPHPEEEKLVDFDQEKQQEQAEEKDQQGQENSKPPTAATAKVASWLKTVHPEELDREPRQEEKQREEKQRQEAQKARQKQRERSSVSPVPASFLLPDQGEQLARSTFVRYTAASRATTKMSSNGSDSGKNPLSSAVSSSTNQTAATSAAPTSTAQAALKAQVKKLHDDAFWEFLFSKHKTDRDRQEKFIQMVSILLDNGKRLKFASLNDHYLRKHGEQLTPRFLRELFCTSLFARGQETEMLKRCTRVFRIEEHFTVCYVLDETVDNKDIFVSSAPQINSQMYLNVKLADKVFEILPNQRRMSIQDVMCELVKTREYRDVKSKYPELPHIEPIKFVGFLQLYWNDVFKIFPENGELWIRRQTLHHQKPSQDKSKMKEIMTSLPRYPLPAEMFEKSHVVKVYVKKMPSDGIAVQMLQYQDTFEYVQEELRQHFAQLKCLTEQKQTEEKRAMRLHPNETYEGTSCLRLDGDVFKRCIITGQSNGLAMVQDVDFAWHGLHEIKNLFRVPRHLLGVRQTCIYGIFENFLTLTTNSKVLWDEEYKKLNAPNLRIVARFHRPCERVDYSGRRKFSIFIMTLQVNEIGKREPLRMLPGDY